MKQESRHYVRARSNLLIDVATFVVFLIATAPRLSGIAIHEWLGIAFAAAIVVHLLLHWQWIIAMSKTLLRRARASSRLSYLLNLALFIDVTLLTFTGIMISEVILPLFGLRMPRAFLWRGLHDLTSNIAVLLTGLHIALHWQWVLQTTARLIGMAGPAGKPRSQEAPR